jgi:hypothetical protein
MESRTNRELEEMSKGSSPKNCEGKMQGKTQERMESGSRRRPSGAGSEKMERVDDR